MKARIALRQLEIPYEAVTVDLFRRETRTPEHMARNPDGRVPVLELDSGDMIPESGAILLYLAEGTPLLPGRPAGPRGRAPVDVLRAEPDRVARSRSPASSCSRAATSSTGLTDSLVARGHGALSSLARGLADERPFICGEDYTVADIALYAYVHCAHEAGADAREHGTIGAWLDRVEATPGFENDLAPFPPHAMVAA